MLFTNICKAILGLATGESKGKVVKKFCSAQGTVYMKLAQILAMQNYGDLFTEKDRQDLLSITDNVNPCPFSYIKKSLQEAYGDNLRDVFRHVCTKPVGAASISQVHKGVLLNGDIVAIKVKRLDVTKQLHHDVKVIKVLTHLFGKLFNFSNYIGGDTALSCFEDWILEETDFVNEVNNLKKYSQFAKQVNGKVAGCSNITVPRVYEELCTDNIIVMEFIADKTINNITDRKVVIPAIESYIKLSFYALLNGKIVCWHGDPHGGNIYITESGDIGFLDLGLLFELTHAESKLCRQLFFSAYFMNAERLYELISPWLSADSDKDTFKHEIEVYCKRIPQRPVTYYFMDLVWVCTRISIRPPKWLFCMAKAFVCLNGIDHVYFNDNTGHDLLSEQVIEYVLRKASRDLYSIAKYSAKTSLSALIIDKPGLVSNLTRLCMLIRQFKE